MRWRFFADGPVRFAPIATNDELYFGADDGCLYCLEASTGKFNWKLNATPANRRAINELGTGGTTGPAMIYATAPEDSKAGKAHP